MSSAILPLRPTNNVHINDPANEALRLAFLNRFLQSPCLWSICMCIKDYLTSTTLSDNYTYDYAYVSKVWRRDGVVRQITEAELYILVANYEGNSFTSRMVNIIIDDCQYNVDTQQAIVDTQRGIINTQQAIIDDENSTQAQIDTATATRDTAIGVKDTAQAEVWKYKAMKDNLVDYKRRFLNYETISKEILPTLSVMLSADA